MIEIQGEDSPYSQEAHGIPNGLLLLLLLLLPRYLVHDGIEDLCDALRSVNPLAKRIK